MSVNKVLLIGRLGKDPDVRYTPSGAAVATFGLATSETWYDKDQKKQQKTEWHNIVVWGKLAELCKEYLKKGKQVFVEGRLQTRQWKTKDGGDRYTTEIIASIVQFLEPANDPKEHHTETIAQPENNVMGQYAAQAAKLMENEDIPF